MKKTTKQITIDGETYEVNLADLIKKGLLKKLHKVKDGQLEVGDVFHSPSQLPMLLVESFAADGAPAIYTLLGRDGLKTYSDGGDIGGVFRTGPKILAEILAYLTRYEYKFIRNINEEVKELVDNA
jgi:hypothetical protein